MARECDVCGKSAVLGYQISQRGKAKYLGGNGRKTTGITRRQFRPNLQRVRVQDGESSRPMRVCTSCIRSGRIQKAVVRKPFTIAPAAN